MTNGTKQVFFSEGDYGYRATPGNRLVDTRHGDPDEVVFHNLTAQAIVLLLPLQTQTERRALVGSPRTALPIAAHGHYTLDLSPYGAGQYFYTALVGDTGLEVEGGSSPGIIITR